MKENTLEQRLKYLYTLQGIDTQLQDIDEEKGDLPGIVQNLETQVHDAEAKIKELQLTMLQLKADRDRADMQIVDLTEKIERYKHQQLQVKSNKQYDALTKEIDLAESNISKSENEMETIEGRLVQSKTDLESVKVHLEDVKTGLKEQQKELHEVNKVHEQEELKLKHQREKVVVRVDKTDLYHYERIRKAKGGKAVVAVTRGACGGCYNRIPPQKILELRQNSQFFTCEHCGRILVSDEIVTMTSAL